MTLLQSIQIRVTPVAVRPRRHILQIHIKATERRTNRNVSAGRGAKRKKRKLTQSRPTDCEQTFECCTVNHCGHQSMGHFPAVCKPHADVPQTVLLHTSKWWRSNRKCRFFNEFHLPLVTRNANGTATPAAPAIKSIDVMANQCFDGSHSAFEVVAMASKRMKTQNKYPS